MIASLCEKFHFRPGDFEQMEWATFVAWLKTRKRLDEGPGVSPDSWQGYDRDPWFQEQRRLRDEARAQR